MQTADYLESIVETILRLGTASSPNETGGLIIPDLTCPPTQWVVELKNISEEPTDSCLFDLHTLEEDHRGKLGRVEDASQVWLWHTHPGGNIGPSRMDLQHRVVGVNYLVVAIPTGEAVRY